MEEIFVLIVEDNRLVARDIQELLTANGYKVSDIVSSGKEALDSIQKWRPNAVLMDIQLKGNLDGISTAKIIRDKYDIPIIFLTAYSDKQTLQSAKDSDPYAFLIKPFNERELFTAVEIAVYKNSLERELKENKLWFSNTLNSLGEGVIATDNELTIQFINPAAESLTGWKINEAFKKKLFEVVQFLELLDNNPVAISGQELLEAMSGRFTHDYYLLHKGGSATPVSCSISQIQDINGNQLGLVLVFRDITLQIRSSQKLHQLKRAIEQSSEFVFIANREGLIEFANPAFEKIAKNGSNDVLGKDFVSILSKTDSVNAEKFRTILLDVFKGRECTETFSFSRKGHLDIDIWALFSPVKDQHNTVINLLCVARDLTLRKRLESIAEAVNVMDNIGYVFSGIRHEIGNPINTVKMILSLLKEEQTISEEKKLSQYLDNALHEIRRVEGLLLSLKSYNMFEKTVPEMIEMNEFFERFFALIRPDLEQRHISLVSTLESPRITCYADPRALQQVLLNLTTNAIDAIKEIPSPKIQFTIRSFNGMTDIQVIDNGTGFDGEIRKNLFKPFYTNKEKGTGLGLVITKKLIVSMRGTIQIERDKASSVTIITISLPSKSPKESL